MIEYLTNMPPWHAVQLAIALSFGIILFLYAYLGGTRTLYKLIVVLIPFQLIESKYGSSNMVITYIIMIAAILNQSWIKSVGKSRWPLIWVFLIILSSFLISWTQAPDGSFNKTSIYLIMLMSSVFLFYFTYHFLSTKDDIIELIRLLFISNVIVIIYCLITVLMIGKNTALFGIEEFRLNGINPKLMRIVGPFSAIGITAEYIVLQSALILYTIINSNRFNRYFLTILFISNFAILIGTGNRGGMISYFLLLVLFAYYHRKILGTVKTILLLSSVFVILVSSSLVMVKFSKFNVVFDRLMNTEMEGMTPDTRQRDWFLTMKKIPEKLIIGHGPRIILGKETKGIKTSNRGHIDFYPHNLYLFILYTTGLLGFCAYLILCISYFYALLRIKSSFAERNDIKDQFITGLPIIGFIIFMLFIFDQMKIEFLRHNLLDYQHYLAVLFAMFYSLTKIEPPEDSVKPIN